MGYTVLDFGLGMHMWDIPKTRYDKPNYLKVSIYPSAWWQLVANEMG